METTIYPTPSIVRETSGGIERIPIADEMFARREIECVGAIGETAAYGICQQLRQLAHEDAGAEITIYVNSPGGSVQDGMAIYDTMRAIGCPIRTVCLGKAVSFAAVLLMAGDRREMLPHARVMLHDPRTLGIGFAATSVEAASSDIAFVRRAIAQMISAHTGHDVGEVLDVTARDTWFDADEAVAWGIADAVVHHL